MFVMVGVGYMIPPVGVGVAKTGGVGVRKEGVATAVGVGGVGVMVPTIFNRAIDVNGLKM